MYKNCSARQRALKRRRIFLFCCAVILILMIALIVFIIKAVVSGKADNGNESSAISSAITSQAQSQSASSRETVSSGPEMVQRGEYMLDANYSNLLLVNDKNPLPENYDYEKNFTDIPNEYLNNDWFKQIGGKIDKDVWPYMEAMIEAAWKDNVKLYVWSPYRSYDTQKSLFQKQVDRQLAKGLSQTDAENAAATVVARPGTSEHHTGLAADFNMADDKFETTQMFTWMQQHAAEYGFIMRYSGQKQEITGVIHESWHYRFVGINAAQEMNQLGMCLEEYAEYKNQFN